MPSGDEMKEFAKYILKGVSIGAGIFLSYILFVRLIAPSGEEQAYFPQSHEKVKIVHAIGVYEGDYPDGVSHSAGSHPEGKIDVTVEKNPQASSVILVLMSYEPINWHIKEKGGAKVEKVILSGYYPSKVTGLNDIPILRENLGYTYKKTDLSSVETKIKATTCLDVKTFQGGYKGKYFEIF